MYLHSMLNFSYSEISKVPRPTCELTEIVGMHDASTDVAGTDLAEDAWSFDSTHRGPVSRHVRATRDTTVRT
jgi:hypothetical protein